MCQSTSTLDTYWFTQRYHSADQQFPGWYRWTGETTGGVWAEHQKAVSIGGASADGSITSGGGLCAINCTNDWEIYAMHPGVANGLRADGSVTSFAETLDILTLAALCSREGGEVVAMPD